MAQGGRIRRIGILGCGPMVHLGAFVGVIHLIMHILFVHTWMKKRHACTFEDVQN